MKKFILSTLAVIGLCGAMTASQGGDIELLYQSCNCCEGAQNPTCNIIVDFQVISCGKGLNVCDMTPPVD